MREINLPSPGFHARIATMLSRVAVAIVLFVGGMACARAADQGDAQREYENVLAQLLGYDSIEPVADLPKHVTAPEGALTLFADYEHAEGATIRLYIVNRTDKEVLVPTQDGDPYAKLEIENEQGVWERAQSHRYSWCGNSYYHLPLKSGQFLPLKAAFPTEGEERHVRYRLYGGLELSSNEGRGRVKIADVEACRTDTMAVRSGGIEVIRAVLSEDAGNDDDPVGRRMSALHRLGKFPPDQIEPICRDLLSRKTIREREFIFVFGAYRNCPEGFRGYVAPLIGGKTSEQRRRALGRLGRVQDEKITEALLRQAKDPSDPDIELLLDAVSRQEGPQARQLLRNVAASAEYSTQAHLHAEYGLESKPVRASPIRVALEIPSRSATSEAYAPPILIIVTLKNESPDKVSFAYDDVSEVIGLWVMARPAFVPPKPHVKWFQRQEGAQGHTQVTIEPGGESKLQIGLLDYFSFAGVDCSTISVYARCKIPGVHDDPIVSGIGCGMTTSRIRDAEEAAKPWEW